MEEQEEHKEAKISEVKPSCVPHMLIQACEDSELNLTASYDKDETAACSGVRGKSVKDIKEEAEQRKLLLLGFVPTQGKVPVQEPVKLEISAFSGIQTSRPRSRLCLSSKRSIENVEGPSTSGHGSGVVQCCGETFFTTSLTRSRSYLIDRSQLGPGSVFDSHCHLDMVNRRLGDEGGSAKDGEGLGDRFGGCVTNFCDPREWARGGDCSKVSYAVTAADREDNVYLSIGCHPHFADKLTPGGLGQLDRLVRGDRNILWSVVALGECGLDYSAKNNVDKDLQKKVFYDQLKIGLKYNLPIVLHIRDAEEDGYSVLSQAGVPSDWSIHRHCFTGDWMTASTWLNRFPASKIGITGCVTFSGATQVHQTVRNIPLDRLLLETDAPYFLPTGVDKTHYQYTFSQPGHVLHVAAKVAALKELALEDVLAANWRNVTDIYGIKPIKLNINVNSEII
eukprot:GFUD01001836.1.p1 GENE.GFUD01001836.1~~GFUD01001836.1.p1  ORF type:complete len:451 (+),score=137.54 GFUD01001836.1:156-1508(+)